MHPCLRVPEILSLIFRAVSDPELPIRPRIWPATGSSALCKIALTCKTFCGPALDILWYFLPDLVPLVKCLPEDAYQIGLGGEISLGRGLEPEDIDRLLSYARRVRVLGARNPEGCRYGEWGLHRLILPHISSVKRDPGPLLPNVLELSLLLQDFQDMAVFPTLVIGPLLQTIIIVVVLSGRAVTPPLCLPWDNVHSVSAKAFPSITSLTIFIVGMGRSVPFELDMPPKLSQLVANLPRLRKLSVPRLSVTHPDLLKIRTLPNLEMLKIAISVDEIREYLSERTIKLETGFDKLQFLRFATEYLEPCIDFLRSHRLSSLTELSLMLRAEDETAQALPSLLTVLHGRPVKSLRVFEIVRYRHLNSEPLSGPLMSAKSIENLYPFVHLQTVILFVDSEFQFDSDTMENMAKSWPQLRNLGLKDRTIGTIPTQKLEDIAHFTSHCPLLERLAIRVDALHPPQHSSIGEIVPGRKVALFDACTSPIVDHSSVARFLAMIFPNLATLHYGWDDNHVRYPAAEIGYSAVWDLVNEELRPIMIHNSPWRRGPLLPLGA